MATKEESDAPVPSSGTSLNFPSTVRIVTSWQQQAKGVRKKRSRQSSKELSQELIHLASEYDNKSPHELAFEGELSILRTRIDTFGLSLKTRGAKGETLLHSATSGNQIDTMLYLIESGVPLNAVDKEGNTALHVAVINQCIESIHIIINNNADDTICNANQDAPLHIAVRSANKHLVEAFLQHTNIDIVVPGYRKRTPLHIAAEFDYVDIVDALNNCSLAVQSFKDKNSFRLCAADKDKLTPIHFAARCGSSKVLDFMIQNCSQHGYPVELILQFLDEENSTPMHAAIDAGHLNIVKVLLKYGASPIVVNGDQIPPIHLACYQGRIDIVQAMIEHCGRDIVFSTCSDGQTPLHWAARSIHGGQVIHYLVQQGANPKLVSRDGNTALHAAVMHNSLESTRELLAVDKCISSICDNTGRNIIHLAVIRKRKAILQFLLNDSPCAKDLVSHQDNKKCTPLHYALTDSLGDYVSMLVTAMQPHIPHVKDDSGLNYLHLAARSGNWKALRILLNSSFASNMLNEVSSIGATPLHEAAMQGHIQCVEILLSAGAMLHKCYYGYTPFHSAIYKGHYECAKILFEAHPFQKNMLSDKGESALHLAVASSSPKVLKLCLDLDIPITRKSNNDTFLDEIIKSGNIVAARTVIKHDRWHECLNFPVCESRSHYFIQLIQTMPEIAEEVLDRCHQKGFQPKEHIEYFERFDFKYLRLANNNEPGHDDDIEKNEEKVPLFEENEEDMMQSLNIKYKSKQSDNLAVAFATRSYSSMEVLKRMLAFNRVSLLTHPVVRQYLKIKWRGYGRIIYGTHMFFFVLQVLLLSSFVILTPPPRLNITDVTLEVVSSASNTTLLTEVTTSSTVIRFITLAVCFIDTIIWLGNVFSLRLEAVNIIKHELIWMEGLTIASTYAFLIPWKFHTFGFTFVFWQAGAIAIFSGWFSIGLFLKPFDLFGVYVTMFLEVLSSLFKALLVASLFIIAFAFALFILVGDIPPFASIGDSFFTTFSYLLGEINYEVYVRRSDNDSLTHSGLTYIFVLLSAAILAVAVMNLLIGLAVGDIETIRRNALLKQRSTEVRIFTKMEPWLPKFIIRRYDKRFHSIFPNKPVSVIRKIWRYFWRSLKSSDEGEAPNLEKVLERQQLYINCLQQEIAQAKKLHQQQHEELKDLLETIVRQRNDD